jgi:segregation and condensation protein B
METKEMEAVVEGLLFAAGDAVSLEKISEILEIDKKTAKLLLNNMVANSQNSRRGIMMREINGKYQLCTSLNTVTISKSSLSRGKNMDYPRLL